MYCNGEAVDIPPGMIVPQSQDEYEDIRDYYLDKENKLFMCKRFGDCD